MSKTTIDLSGVLNGLNQLGHEKTTTSLLRSMAVAGGQVIRDEAKRRVPVASGKLHDAIYLVYKDGQSTPTHVHYAVSWNSKTAPHGHLVEFGHWRKNAVYTDAQGQWHGKKRRIQARWVPAQPFLRPAYQATKDSVREAIMRRGRERLAELLNGHDGGQKDDAQ